MKKFLFSLITVLCVAVSANAQAIFGYDFLVIEETYTAITDGNVIASGTDAVLKMSEDEDGNPVNNFNEKLILPSGVFAEEVTAAGYPIGFDFKFDEKNFTSFGIATNGAIFLGNETVTMPAEGRYVFTSEFTSNFIGFVPNRGTICNDETVISYKLEGETPNRTLVVEFNDLGALQGYWGTSAYFFDLQIRLHETTNAIDFVVNGLKDALTETDEEGNTFSNTTVATVGIKGEGAEATSVFAGNIAEWNRENGTSNTLDIDNTILDGTTFSLAYPTDVETPTTQPTELIVNQYSTQLTGIFTATENVDKYLLVIQEGKEITTLPTDKVTYNVGDKIGEATVVEYNESSVYEGKFEFEISNLPSSKDYTLAVYAVNAFGINGPAYNTANPLSVVTYTNPAAPTAFGVAEIGDSTAIINLTANEANDKIIVVYNDSLVRDNYGDYPLIGALSGEYVAGQEIEGGGKVAYFGEAGENIEINGLAHSKGYFFEAYSYNATYGYSTDKQEVAQATRAHLPYTLDLAAAKTYGVPAGWSVNEGSTFQVPSSINGFTSEENPYVIWCKVTKKNATEGVINQLTSSPIFVDQRDAVVKFDYTMYYNPSRFATAAYNEWNENDVFAVQVSTDGETFEDLVSYNYENAPEFTYNDTVKTLIPFEGELAKYEGQQIWVRIHWHLFNTTFVPGVFVMDNFTVAGREIPETPIVKVNDITHISAKVEWRGAQENYEVAFAKSGEEFTSQTVEGAKELALTDLEAETEYQVKVRGIAAENDYSYWSEIVTFTTTAWPECEAPTDLTADLTAFAEKQTATLSWKASEDYLTYEVRYRDGNSTTWTTIENLTETTLVIDSLEYATTYLWNVRAYCTMDRVTAWSAQSTFETPTNEGVEEIASSISIYPNPVNDKVYVEADSNIEEVAIYNITGVMISQQTTVNGQQTLSIDMSEMKTGVYFIEIKTNEGNIVKRIVKN